MKNRSSAWGEVGGKRRVVNIGFPGVCSVSTNSCNELWGRGEWVGPLDVPSLPGWWHGPGAGLQGGKGRKGTLPFAPAAAARQNGRVPAREEAVAVPPGAVQAHAAAQALCQPPLPAGRPQREEPQHGGCAIPVGTGALLPALPSLLRPLAPTAHSRQTLPGQPVCLSASCSSSRDGKSPQALLGACQWPGGP